MLIIISLACRLLGLLSTTDEWMFLFYGRVNDEVEKDVIAAQCTDDFTTALNMNGDSLVQVAFQLGLRYLGHGDWMRSPTDALRMAIDSLPGGLALPVGFTQFSPSAEKFIRSDPSSESATATVTS